MKVSKIPFIIPLAIALAFVALLAVFFVIPENTPVIMSEKIEIKKQDDKFVWSGKIKNVTNRVLKISHFEVEIYTDDEYQQMYGELICRNWAGGGSIILQPDEEFDLSTEPFDGGVRVPERVTLVRVSVEGKSYILPITFSQGNNFVWAVFMLVFAVVFGVFSVAAFNGINRQKRRIKYAEEVASSVNGAYVTGFYGKAGEGKKAAVKTAASVTGAIFSSLFLGVGFYKIFTGSTKHDFIITSNEMFIFEAKNEKLDVNKCYRIEKGGLPQSQISFGKRQVVLTCGQGGAFFSFEIKAGGKTGEEIKNMLTELFLSDGDVMHKPEQII